MWKRSLVLRRCRLIFELLIWSKQSTPGWVVPLAMFWTNTSLLVPIFISVCVCVCIIVMVGHLVAEAPFSPSLCPGQQGGWGNFTQTQTNIIIIEWFYIRLCIKLYNIHHICPPRHLVRWEISHKLKVSSFTSYWRGFCDRNDAFWTIFFFLKQTIIR